MDAKQARTLTAFFLILGFLATLGIGAQAAQTAKARALGPVDDFDTVVLAGNVHPLARPEFDIGPADASLPMERMILTLKLGSEKKAELDALLVQQQDPSSPNYHGWLTPEEFGVRFGPSDGDLAVVTGWLEAHGFRVDEVAKGRAWINFTGTVADVESAFHTRIRDYRVGGVLRHANATDPSIPRSLTPVIAGIVSLHSFPLKAMHTPARSATGPAIQPEYTNGSDHYLAPADFATIYNVSPLYGAGIGGTGVTIAIVGRTHPSTALTDWNGFRSTFGLPYNPPNIIVNGADPGDQGPNEDGEADLDVEWSGATAPNATISFVCSKSTASTDGVDLSAQYIINNNLAPVMSTSFGLCEMDLGGAENAFYNSLWAQAAAQGITSFVSSGDNGVAGCDSAGAGSGSGRAVSGLASTPYNVAVGGTQFLDTSNPSSYWSTSNDPSTQKSVISYIPEQAWNESGAASLCPPNDVCSGLWSTSGGASSLYSKPSWQVAPGVPGDGSRDLPDVSLTAGGHDGYLVAISGSIYVIGGTSASSPAFAGLMALVVQKTGQRQGNANTRFYQIGNAQYALGGPAIFHDTTVGNNTVPGVTGFNCGTGYDQATGLGSVDASAMVNGWSGGGGGCPAIALSPSSLPGATVGVAYSQMVTASGGTSPYTFSVTSGGLPSGLTLSTAGVLSGTPPVGGTSSFTVTATDAHSCTGNATYALAVAVPPPVPAQLTKMSPFGIKVTGSNLQNGMRVSINGNLWTNMAWVNTGKVKILGGASLKAMVPKGVPATFTFMNPDGGTATVIWSW